MNSSGLTGAGGWRGVRPSRFVRFVASTLLTGSARIVYRFELTAGQGRSVLPVWPGGCPGSAITQLKLPNQGRPGRPNAVRIGRDCRYGARRMMYG